MAENWKLKQLTAMEDDLIEESFLIGLIIRFLGSNTVSDSSGVKEGETEQEKAGALLWDLSASEVTSKRHTCP